MSPNCAVRLTRRLALLALCAANGLLRAESLELPGVRRLADFQVQLQNGVLELKLKHSAGAPSPESVVLFERGRVQLLSGQPTSSGAESIYAAAVAPVDGWPTPALQAWGLDARSLAATLRQRWPEGCEWTAQVMSISPGARGVWLDRGRDDGVFDDDVWWFRFGGQPLLRADTAYVDAERCYCTLTPLAAETPLRVADRLALWPAPATVRRGGCVSAVALVEAAADGDRAWIAWPALPVPPDAQCEFWRAGTLTALGILLRHDERFGYVQVLTAGRPAIGDEVRLRTRAEIEDRRYTPRVFALGAGGALINAGEAEGLRRDDSAEVFRRAERIGVARVVRVQRTYSTITMTDAAATIEPGDEFRCNPLPEKRREIGVIERQSGPFVVIRPMSPSKEFRLGRPFRGRWPDGPDAVIVGFATEGDAVLGLILEPSGTPPDLTGTPLSE